MDSLEKCSSDPTLLSELQQAFKAHEDKTNNAMKQIEGKLDICASQESCDLVKGHTQHNTSELENISANMKKLEVLCV